INVNTQGFKESLSVEVKRYKLPKFKVEVKVPSYIHSRSTGLTIKLDAKYTFGKGVQGTGLLEVPKNKTRLYMCCTQLEKINFSQNFDGSVELFISTDEINEELGWNGASESIITVTGSVTEALTRETFNDTQRIDAKTTNIKVETLVKPLTIKPGLKYSAYIQVTEVDGKPLPEEDRLANNLLLNIEYSVKVIADIYISTVSAWYAYRREETRVFVIPPSGIVKVTINAPSDNFVSISFRVSLTQQWTAERADSPSNSYLQITTDENSVVPGNMATVTIRTTEAVSEFTILIISRGEILSERKYQTLSGLPENSHFFEFSVEYDMIPGVQVLASYVRNDGEIVADYLKLTVTAELENQVSITSSSTSVDAGEDVSIRVQTSSSGAYVGARAIDQSVLLLKSGNDISQERVSQSSMCFFVMGRPTESRNFVSSLNRNSCYSVFNMNLMGFYLTNISPYRPIALARPFGGFAERNGYVYGAPSVFDYYEYADESPVFAMEADLSAAPPTTVRSFFPETWLWDAADSADGSATFNTTAPDTITSWIFSAFSVSDQHGLGVIHHSSTITSQVTVFRNFFITLNLPVKVIRGELIIVQAIVFNYLSTEVEAVLTLTESNKFVLLRPGNNSAAVGFSRRITVPASGSVSVKFPVRMETLGEIPITMTAISEIASDALTRKVFVQPEGIAQCTSGSVLFQRMDASVPPDMESLNIQIPTGIVPGSEKVKLFVYGDILGSTMNNLGSLLRTPSGCGEQNMLGFAPDVFVTLYLHSAGKLDATVRAKAFKHFQTGYSNELNYKHSDGSFSAFGERDASGSTWLTAFVAKCFMFARELRPTLVSTSVIDQALTFLINQQNTSGTFREPGRVSHKAMQGGVDSPITMTAYVLITLKETNTVKNSFFSPIIYTHILNQAVQEAAENARIYLENHLSSISENKYALAIVTYALHVAGSSRANEALQALEALATVQGGFKFWHDDSELPDSYSSRWRPYYYNPPTNDIEMSAYALLTYVRRNDLNAGIPVMKWLASKRSSLGGYSGTQDTVIAIQALSKVAGLLVGNTQNLQISASHSNNPFTASYNINRENSIVFNSVNVPAVDGTVQVTATGVGVAVAQISVCYNTPSQPYAIEPFQCTNTVVSTASSINFFNLLFCVIPYLSVTLRPGDNATGMFLMEVNLPSGYTVDIDNERTRNPSAKLVEIDGNGVNVYYDEVRFFFGLLSIYSRSVSWSQKKKVAASEYYRPIDEAPVVCDSCSTDDIAVCSVCADCAGCP
uniref:Uncharacterized protein n=1 Tax=Ciona intestinalis TaxID=7719 RepID=F7BB43_CIOIN